MSRAACVDMASARGRRRTDFMEWMVFVKFAIGGGRRPAILTSAGSIASARASRGDTGVTPGAFVDRLTRRAEAIARHPLAGRIVPDYRLTPYVKAFAQEPRPMACGKK